MIAKVLNWVRKEAHDQNHGEELKQHVVMENPILKDVVDGFLKLDLLLTSIGYFNSGESLTKKMSWWPVISVLGTYSAGKSSFINFYLKYPIQETGVQAVDDKFTVICYSQDENVTTLPGFALDSDPRFPFYKISKAIDEVAPGEGAYLDSYLQLKTCPSERLKGKIFIDSPGFDADEKRSSILRITDRIIDLSDLVLVFFDARHPEPGSMRDTLEHLVKNTVKRRDANKFLYILNQIDVTAKEDNLEDVFASWQRALVRYGVTAGKYFCIYNPDSCNIIEDEEIRKRYERKRDQDLTVIEKRIEDVKIERTYRLIGLLREHIVKLKDLILPEIKGFRKELKKYMLVGDSCTFLIFLILFGMFNSMVSDKSFLSTFSNMIIYMFSSLGGFLLFVFVAGLFGGIHFFLKNKIGNYLIKKLLSNLSEEERTRFQRAFTKNLKWYESLIKRFPAGWNEKKENMLNELQIETNKLIQRLNMTYTDPSGERGLFNSK